MRTVPTICPLCASGCGVYMEADNGGITGIYPARGHCVARGSLCVRGWHLDGLAHVALRKTQPMLKRDGRWQEVEWAQAMEVAASSLGRIRARFGGEALGVVASMSLTNEQAYLASRLARMALTTNNIDSASRFYEGLALHELRQVLRWPGMMTSLDEIGAADVLLVTSSSLAHHHPHALSRVLKALDAGARLVVLDSRAHELAHLATIHLQPRPGAAAAVANGLAAELISLAASKKEPLPACVTNVTAVEAAFAKHGAEATAKATGVAGDRVKQAAEHLAQAGRLVIVVPAEQVLMPGLVAGLLNVLVLSGKFGQPGSGLNVLRVMSNAQGVCDMGALPDMVCGYQAVAEAAVAEKFAKVWGGALPSSRGLRLPEMLAQAAAGELAGLVVLGEELLATAPYPELARQALEKLESVVYVGAYWTDTAAEADVFLPATSGLEREGTLTNTDGHVQEVRPVLAPEGESRSEDDIIMELSARLGHPMTYGDGSAIRSEIAHLCGKDPVLIERGLDSAFMSRRWTFGGPADQTEERVAVSPAAVGPEPSDEFPYIMELEVRYRPWYVHPWLRGSHALRREFVVPRECYVEINVQDAEELGVRSGQRVKITSQHGEAIFRVATSPDVAPRAVLMPALYVEAARTVLGPPCIDQASGAYVHAPCPVRVETAS